MNTEPSRLICVCALACLTISCLSLRTAKSGPDDAIQEQIEKAGLALLNVPGDTTKNYLKDLKGDAVPREVRTLERMLNGDRVKALQQLVYYIDGAKAIRDQVRRETRGWVTLAVAAYFNFTPAEVDYVASLMPRTENFCGMPPELVGQAKANHPTSAVRSARDGPRVR